MKRSMVLLCVLALTGTAVQAANYGVIFSGGVDADNNHDRYYEQTLRIWDIYTNTLGYPVQNVHVLFADGTNPAVDRSSGANSDWSMIQGAGGNITAATAANLQSTLTGLQGVLTPEDCFHFWSFDHGYNSDPPVQGHGGMCAWGSPWIADDAFASWVNPIGAGTKSFAFGQCYAGDMADDLDLSGNAFAAWSAAWYEPAHSYVNPYDGWIGRWAEAIDRGLRYTHDIGQYAKLNDPFGPQGLGIDHPGWTGANFHIVTNEPIPAPGAVLLGTLGTGLVTWLRRRRTL